MQMWLTLLLRYNVWTGGTGKIPIIFIRLRKLFLYDHNSNNRDDIWNRVTVNTKYFACIHLFLKEDPGTPQDQELGRVY